MIKYALRRIIYMIPILLGITLITFLLFNVAGGDPAANFAGKYATQEEIDLRRKELGLDKSLPMQYLHFVKQVLTFDYGTSWSSKQQVTSMIAGGVGASLSLTVPAFALTLMITISLALVLAQFRGGKFDQSMMIFCLALMSLSSLVYILYGQYFLSYKLELFPISGWDDGLIERWQYLTLPILIFISLSLGGNILFYRTVFLDEMFQDYVRTAKAKGLSNRVVLFKHVLRNAMIPIITQVALAMPFLILGSLLLENFFSIPGVGGMMVQAIQNADLPVIKAMTVLGAILYMIFQLVSDLLYAVADPKVQLR